MPMPTIPAAKGLVVCDRVVEEGGNLDLVGVFNSRRHSSYPVVLSTYVFAQLAGAVGQVPSVVLVRHVEADEYLWETPAYVVNFADQGAVVQLVLLIRFMEFRQPGAYAFELYCHNTLVCDTTIFLL